MRKSIRYFIPGVLLVSFSGPVMKADVFTFSGVVQTYITPVAGVYDIMAAGAQGGTGGSPTGGLGAFISGDIYLTAGETLDIVVGGAGTNGSVCVGVCGGGGGGGSFVYIQGALTPLIVAGGGGGGGYSGANGGNGLITTAGGTNPLGAPGGTTGSGGSGSSSSQGGGGGGGWLSKGGNQTLGCGGAGGFAPPSFSGGGGIGGCEFASGGFGGGGGGGYNGGGGGGGYSGGGGGYIDGGGGGGSYIDAAFTSPTLTAGSQTGNGEVTISLQTAAVPEPSSVALLTTILVGLVFTARRQLSSRTSMERQRRTA